MIASSSSSSSVGGPANSSPTPIGTPGNPNFMTNKTATAIQQQQQQLQRSSSTTLSQQQVTSVGPAYTSIFSDPNDILTSKHHFDFVNNTNNSYLDKDLNGNDTINSLQMQQRNQSNQSHHSSSCFCNKLKRSLRG